MIEDLASINSLRYEFTIIGTGPAGISTALELEKKGRSVLLVEGGGHNYSESSQDVYGGKVVGNYSYSISDTRLRFFGGSSNHWGGWCRPLDEVDYEKFPINKNDLDPYLQKASNILEIDGKFDSDRFISKNFKQIEFQYSPPVRFGDKYRKHIENSHLIGILINTNVLGIYANDRVTSQAEYIDVIHENLGKRKLKINYLIVACGGIENSRLLLWSKDNGKLFSNLVVGKGWMEHPNYYEVGKIIAYNEKIFELLKPFPARRIEVSDNLDYFGGVVYLQPTKLLMENTGSTNARLGLSLTRHTNSLKRSIKEILCQSPEYGKKLALLANQNLVCSISVSMLWEQESISENRIELDYSNRDKYGIPRTKLIWGLSQNDKNTPQICMEKLGEFFLDKELGRVGISSFIEDNSVFPPGQFGGHHMGGTPMGVQEDGGVVDRNLKIFGTDNVYVVGSSTFPSSGHANPTLTIVQMSLRLANHLVKKCSR
jgi:hypothetical protein